MDDINAFTIDLRYTAALFDGKRTDHPDDTSGTHRWDFLGWAVVILPGEEVTADNDGELGSGTLEFEAAAGALVPVVLGDDGYPTTVPEILVEHPDLVYRGLSRT